MARIVELRVEGFRRIRAVLIRPDGSLVVLSGRNGEGKSSVLYAIWAAFKGRAVAGPVPIREDAEQCVIRCETDEFTVTRTFKRAADDEVTTDVRVVMADGRRIDRKPQAMLDALLPDLALDPLEFMRRPLRDQIDTLKRLVPGFDFAKNAHDREEAFTARTVFNRMRDAAQAAAERIMLPAGPEPQRVDTNALAAAISDATRHNSDIEARRRRRDEAQRDIDAKMDEAEQLRVRAATLERDAKALQERLNAAEALPAPMDIQGLSAQLAGATEVNRVADLFAQRRKHESDCAAQADESERLTAEIRRLDDEKRRAIANARLPVDGLSFDDNSIVLNGVPFEQASLAEKLRASVGIGMALCPPAPNPALRIMTIDEGSELDSYSLALLGELADQHGYQVWIARVSDEGGRGFIIEDGQLAGATSS